MAELKTVIDAPTEEPWGLLIETGRGQGRRIARRMKRSMSLQAEPLQAEAARERRARVIAADGEYQASDRLAQAAERIAATPSALQLRLPQTVVDVAAEKNSGLVMPFPVELLRFFERANNETARPAASKSAMTTSNDHKEEVPAS